LDLLSSKSGRSGCAVRQDKDLSPMCQGCREKTGRLRAEPAPMRTDRSLRPARRLSAGGRLFGAKVRKHVTDRLIAVDVLLETECGQSPVSAGASAYAQRLIS
jgi:hypothetical protein